MRGRAARSGVATGFAAAHQRARRGHSRRRDGCAARPLPGIRWTRLSSSRLSTCTRRARTRSAARSSKSPLGPGFDVPARRRARSDHRAHAHGLADQSQQPDGPEHSPRGHPAASRRRRADALVFVDEAYVDFGGGTLISDPVARAAAARRRRTDVRQSVRAGRPSRRGGDRRMPETIAPLRRVIPPYSLNVCAAAALPAAFGDTRVLRLVRRQVAESKPLLYGGFERLGVAYWKSDANFVLARFRRVAAAIAAALAARGVHVRDRSRDPGCADCLRITAGVVEHTRTVLDGARGGAVRRATIKRVTKETPISLRLALDGKGRYDVRTGIRFLDHMLELFARHGGFDLKSTPRAISTSISITRSRTSASRSAKRFGRARQPARHQPRRLFPDADGRNACGRRDRSRRPHPHRRRSAAEGPDASAISRRSSCTDFFEGFAQGARANVHVKVLYGRSSHHHVEAVFKAFARALRVACARDRRLARMLPSTKGLL